MTTSDIVLFWGYKGKVEKACFSQWFMRDFEVDGHRYCCMEQYMMAQKATLFNDQDALIRILNSTDPAEIKQLGRQVKNFDPAIWNQYKSEIVVRGNLAKFSQNGDLKEILLATGDKILAEGSPYDRIWGIGLRAADPRATDPQQWPGQNLLGQTLMQVRETLRFI